MKKLCGLTGKTGAGKSTVCDYLKQKGAYIIDGDTVARSVFFYDEGLLKRLQDAFGEDIAVDGVLQRKILAKKAFSTPENTALLNSVMHPAINELIETECQKAFSEYDVVIVDAAAIIESGFAEKCKPLIVVTAPEAVRKERIIKRDDLTEEDAMARINGQKDDRFYIEKGDIIIKNYSPHNLEEQLRSLEKEIFELD